MSLAIDNANILLVSQQEECFQTFQGSKNDLVGKPFHNAFDAAFAQLVLLREVSGDVTELLAILTHRLVFLVHLYVFPVFCFDAKS